VSGETVSREEVDRRVVHRFTMYWPQSMDWPEYIWQGWREALSEHGPSWNARALRQLREDPAFKSFPPGLAAFMQVLDELEYELRYHLSVYRRRLEQQSREPDPEITDEMVADWHASVATIKQELAE
jgi:hypothetical protein